MRNAKSLKPKRIFLKLCIIILIGVAIPKVLIYDSIHVSDLERRGIFDFLNAHRDNPIQRALTMNIVIDRRVNEIFYVSTYTFFGIKCEQIKVEIERRAKTIYRNRFC